MTKIENGNSSHGNDVDEEFLSFVLGDESYALDIMSVKEIRGYETVTKIANAPAFVKGVLNLRGDIVPIVDLRMKFDIGQATYDEFTIVISLGGWVHTQTYTHARARTHARTHTQGFFTIGASGYPLTNM